MKQCLVGIDRETVLKHGGLGPCRRCVGRDGEEREEGTREELVRVGAAARRPHPGAPARPRRSTNTREELVRVGAPCQQLPEVVSLRLRQGVVVGGVGGEEMGTGRGVGPT